MKIVPTARQTDFYFMPFGSLTVWLSPILPTYLKLRLLDFWCISWFSLRFSPSCSGCVYPWYSITCLPSRPKGLSCDHCQQRLFSVIAIYPWEPALSHPTPSPLTLACLLASQVLQQHLAWQSADWLTPRVFCTWDSFLSCRETFFVMETPLPLSCFFDKTGLI